MTNEELLSMASVFTVMEDQKTASDFATVTVERRRQRDGTYKWAIYKDGSVFYKHSRLWGSDGLNSSRTDSHIAETRFDSLEEAMRAAKEEVLVMRGAQYNGYYLVMEQRLAAVEARDQATVEP